MSTAKTTVYLDAADYERLKAIARRERRADRAAGNARQLLLKIGFAAERTSARGSGPW